MIKDNFAVVSIAIALVALLMIISSISFAIFSGSGQKASVQNLIDPLASFEKSTSQAGTTIIHISDGSSSSSDDDEDDEDPDLEFGPTIYIEEDDRITLNLDDFADDKQDSDSELVYTVLLPLDDDVIEVTLDSVNREIMIDADGNDGESDVLRVQVEDTDGNTDIDSVTVVITSGSVSVNSPVISAIPDVFMLEDGTDYLPLSLDDYVTDPDDDDDDLTWTFSGNTNVIVSIDPLTRNVTFTVTPEWSGSEWIDFRVEDDNGNWDEDTMMVSVTNVDDAAVWNPLLNQNIQEDTADGTVIYPNVVLEASDIDSPVVVSVVSTSTHYTLSIVGNDLVINNLEANWYGSETVTLDANGIQTNFQLNVAQLFDDYHKVCGQGGYVCEEWYD